MRKFLKIFLIVFAVIVFAVASLLTYVKTALPDVGPPPDLKVEITPERIERGKYLATNVAVCMDCHSSRDWSQYSGPLVPGTLGKGGETFDQKFGFPGAFYSRNITPAKLKNWTDGEIFRAITSGVNKDGKALFPVMPHPNYGKLNQEDIHNIIAYLRTIPAIENEVQESVPDFPMNFIINTIPQKPNFSEVPSKSDTINYGKYMITAASCMDCHTKRDKGEFVEGMYYAGGMEFPFPDGSIVRSSNITPDQETGIGRWNKKAFINRFKQYKDSSYILPKIAPGQFNTIMPWTMYAGMEEEDLGAIYSYLASLKPIKNQVEMYTPAK